ncbi:hypothetical protein RND71_023350 [Anisodus tanguticus]|uniref:Protein TAR1 n=1 Tax=Anisodus tanguticus TaxID=243964 RepID=A0AAE1RSX8_9SOLA|nr:hypothetical protein RND71_023350 [Anisodus tanguticus]
MPKHAVGGALPATNVETAFRGRIESPGFGRPPIHAGPRPESIGGPAHRRSTSDRGSSPAPIRFPPDNFKHSLTLFSKSYSSSPRGTCSLSVSRPYLDLDGIHRPIWAAFPNNPTRRQRLVVRQGPGTTGISPSPAPPFRGLGPGPPLRTLLQTTIRTTEPPDSKTGLFPVSLAVTRGILRVIPPDLGRGRSAASAKRVWESEGATGYSRDSTRVGSQPPHAATSIDVDPYLGRPRARGAREASIRPATPPRPAERARHAGVTRCVTSRQTCPRPNGIGRNLRSKTRWFTGFCNSHQGSLVARRARARVGDGREAARRGGAEAPRTPLARLPRCFRRVRGSFCCAGFDNDPSAGSPMETLLRLLLPLNDKVQWTSRNVAGSEPPTSLRSEHFTGSFNR